MGSTTDAVLLLLVIGMVVLLIWSLQSKPKTAPPSGLSQGSPAQRNENAAVMPQALDKRNTGLVQYEASHRAKALVLSCMDYRLVDTTISLLEATSLSEAYDFTTLPGAAIGFNEPPDMAWRTTLTDTLKLAIELHHIEAVLVIDHQDCGYGKAVFPDYAENELMIHQENLSRFCRDIKSQFPTLDVSGYLLSLNGNITRMA
jgi:carbonic anhydrase